MKMGLVYQKSNSVVTLWRSSSVIELQSQIFALWELDLFLKPSQTHCAWMHYISLSGLVYNNIKLFEIIANCSQTSSDFYDLNPIFPLVKLSFLSYIDLKPIFVLENLTLPVSNLSQTTPMDREYFILFFNQEAGLPLDHRNGTALTHKHVCFHHITCSYQYDFSTILSISPNIYSL